MPEYGGSKLIYVYNAKLPEGELSMEISAPQLSEAHGSMQIGLDATISIGQEKMRLALHGTREMAMYHSGPNSGTVVRFRNDDALAALGSFYAEHPSARAHIDKLLQAVCDTYRQLYAIEEVRGRITHVLHYEPDNLAFMLNQTIAQAVATSEDGGARPERTHRVDDDGADIGLP